MSPRLFDQGSQWFTLTYLHQALTGATAVAVVNSLWVSTAAALMGVLIGFPIAWLAARTTMPGRRFVSGRHVAGPAAARPGCPRSAGNAWCSRTA